MTQESAISADELRHLVEAVVEMSKVGEPWAATLTWVPGPGLGLVSSDPATVATLRRLGFHGERQQ